MKITIKQIAEEANVSVTTVSNVINQKAHRVSEEKRTLIQSIIDKYSYTPNMNARSLVKSSSSLIALLYYSSKKSTPINFSNSFVSEILEGVERKVKELGYFTLIHNVSSIEDIQSIQNNWRFDGFIAVNFSQFMFREMNEKINGPVVFVDTHLDQDVYKEIDSYDNRVILNTDDYNVSRKATSFLIEEGHTHIAFMSHPYNESKPSVNRERFNGYRKALDDNQLIFEPSQKFFSTEFQLFLQKISNFSAIVVFSDELALEVMHFLSDHEVKIPQDMSVIGFDGIRYGEYSNPPLTTIRLNQIRKGEKAMALLEDIIQSSNHNINKLVLLSGNVIERESVGKPKI